jgi:hypothetical protein
VGTSHFRDASLEALDRELDVARHPASKEAPIVNPSADVPAGPHRAENLTVTLWQFYEDQGSPGDDTLFGPLLARIHEDLLDYQGALPAFTAELEDVGRILLDRSRLPRLRDEDHAFLLRTHQELQPVVSSAPWCHPIHGRPHTGNWLKGSAGLLLLDFETACRGPVEWDLSATTKRSTRFLTPIGNCWPSSAGCGACASWSSAGSIRRGLQRWARPPPCICGCFGVSHPSSAALADG